MSISPFEEYLNIVETILSECSKDKNLKKIILKKMKEEEK